jgi:hypothetical protein
MATRAFARYFDVVIGSDAGESMIKVATEIGGTSAKGGPIQWAVCPAEEIDKIPGIESLESRRGLWI